MSRFISLHRATPHTALPAQGKPDSPDDVVIVCALRTPITKARKGGLRDTSAEDLLAAVLKGVLQRTKIDPAIVGDVVVGSVLGSNVWRANQARIACFLAGMPDTVWAPSHNPCSLASIRPGCSTGFACAGARARGQPAVLQRPAGLR